jgi:hypothetical protein
MRILRSLGRPVALALAGLLLFFQLEDPASAGRKGFGTGFRKGSQTTVGVPAAAVPYNTLFGVTDASTGWIDFPLHSGNRRIWLAPAGSGGSDSHTCLSFAQACLTWDHAYAVYRSGHTGGDQIMVGGPGTYTDNGLTDDFQNLASGISMTYPNAILSYDVADPTNTAKYGKIVGSGRPVLIVNTPNATLGMAGGTGSGNFAVQGLDLDANSQPEVHIIYAANDVTQHNGIVYQNVRFKGVRLAMGLGPPGPDTDLVSGTPWRPIPTVQEFGLRAVVGKQQFVVDRCQFRGRLPGAGGRRRPCGWRLSAQPRRTLY